MRTSLQRPWAYDPGARHQASLITVRFGPPGLTAGPANPGQGGGIRANLVSLINV